MCHFGVLKDWICATHKRLLALFWNIWAGPGNKVLGPFRIRFLSPCTCFYWVNFSFTQKYQFVTFFFDLGNVTNQSGLSDYFLWLSSLSDSFVSAIQLFFNALGHARHWIDVISHAGEAIHCLLVPLTCFDLRWWLCSTCFLIRAFKSALSKTETFQVILKVLLNGLENG